MKTINWIFCVLVMMFIFQSCKNEVKLEGPTQMEQVVAVHDELMPKMSTIGSLITQLNNSPDSIQNRDAVNDLKASHDSMMNWMQEFGDQFDFEEVLEGKALSEEKQKMLDVQQEKVMALKAQMNGSIEHAKKLLEAH